jgi:hypothetical protein
MEPDTDDDQAEPKLDIVSEHALGSEEDAPMTLAVTAKVWPSSTTTELTVQGTIVTGINQSESTIAEKKQNRHLRLFELTAQTTSPKIVLRQQKQIFSSSTPFNPEHYQRVTRFNRHADPSLLAIASTSGDLSVLAFPSLEQVYSMRADGDIYSLDFSPADNDTVRPKSEAMS